MSTWIDPDDSSDAAEYRDSPQPTTAPRRSADDLDLMVVLDPTLYDLTVKGALLDALPVKGSVGVGLAAVVFSGFVAGVGLAVFLTVILVAMTAMAWWLSAQDVQGEARRVLTGIRRVSAFLIAAFALVTLGSFGVDRSAAPAPNPGGPVMSTPVGPSQSTTPGRLPAETP